MSDGRGFIFARQGPLSGILGGRYNRTQTQEISEARLLELIASTQQHIQQALDTVSRAQVQAAMLDEPVVTLRGLDLARTELVAAGNSVAFLGRRV
jgi:hypothetical protein